MNTITTKCVIPGQYIESTVELGGMDYKVLVYYDRFKGLPAEREKGGMVISPAEPPFVEITNVLIEINDDFFQLETRKQWDEDMVEEIIAGFE